MVTKTDGGPAFPFGQISETTGQPVNGFYDPGMSLRDWFAGMALQGVCAAGINRDWSNALLAQAVYQLADDMLKAREL